MYSCQAFLLTTVLQLFFHSLYFLWFINREHVLLLINDFWVPRWDVTNWQWLSWPGRVRLHQELIAMVKINEQLTVTFLISFFLSYWLIFLCTYRHTVFLFINEIIQIPLFLHYLDYFHIFIFFLSACFFFLFFFLSFNVV